MNLHLLMIIECGVFLVLGIVLGNAAVYLFNHVPGKWLCDYGQEPDEELLHPTCQRVKSTPWKFVFSGAFVVIGIYMGTKEPFYALPAVFAMWMLLEMSIADIKYMIVPDQFIIGLLVCGLGILPTSEDLMINVYGAAAAFVVLIAIAGLSKLIYKQSAIGGADIKLFTALGLLTGIYGVAIIFVLSTLISAGHFVVLLILKKAKLRDRRPMVPYIAGCAAFYMVFLRDLLYNGFDIAI